MRGVKFMKDNQKLLLGLSCFLGGIVTGFLIAPIKQGMYFGNNFGDLGSNVEDLKKVAEK